MGGRLQDETNPLRGAGGMGIRQDQNDSLMQSMAKINDRAENTRNGEQLNLNYYKKAINTEQKQTPHRINNSMKPHLEGLQSRKS